MKKRYMLILLFMFTLLITTACNNTALKEEADLEKIDKVRRLDEQYKQVLSLVSEKKLTEAKELLDKLIQEDDTNGYFELTYGNIHRKEKDNEKALQRFIKAIEKDPKIKEAYNNSAGIKMLEKKYDEAMEIIERGLKENPDYTELIFKKAQLFFIKEEFEETIRLLEQLKEKPEYFEAYRFIGLSYLSMSQKEKAIEHLNTYIEKAPDGLPVKEKIKEIVKNAG